MSSPKSTRAKSRAYFRPTSSRCRPLEVLPTSATSLVSMDAARDAATARDAAALQRQRDRNIKKRDEERAKLLASEKVKKTRLAAERRVRSCCS